MGLFSKQYNRVAREFFTKVNPGQEDHFIDFVRLERITLSGAIGRGLGGLFVAATMKFDILVFYKDHFLIVYNEDFKGKSPQLKIPFSETDTYGLRVKKHGLFNPKKYIFEWTDRNKKYKGGVAGSKKDGNINRLGPQLIKITESVIQII